MDGVIEQHPYMVLVVCLVGGSVALLLITATAHILRKRRTFRLNRAENLKIYTQQLPWYNQNRLAVLQKKYHSFTIPKSKKPKEKKKNKNVHPKAVVSPLTTKRDSLAVENETKMTRWRSEEILSPPIKKSLVESTNANSCMSINNIHDEEPDRIFSFTPSCDISLVWASSSSTLNLTISKFSNLPAKLQRSHIVATVKLVAPHVAVEQESRSVYSPLNSPLLNTTLPDTISQRLDWQSEMSQSTPSLHTATFSSPSRPSKIKKTLDNKFSQVFTFHDLNFEELKETRLLLEFKEKRKGLIGSKAFGEVCYYLSESNPEPNKPILVTLKLQTPRKLSQSLLPQISPLHNLKRTGLRVGAVQVILKYQITGTTRGRIKMVITRGRSMVPIQSGGELKFDIVVRSEGEVIMHQKTPLVSSCSLPIWNYSLIFDIQQNKISDITIEATLIRVGRTRRSTKLGYLFLGPNTTEQGKDHWQEIIGKTDREITKWHPVLN